MISFSIPGCVDKRKLKLRFRMDNSGNFYVYFLCFLLSEVSLSFKIWHFFILSLVSGWSFLFLDIGIQYISKFIAFWMHEGAKQGSI